MAPSKTSRKGKKAWRKNINTRQLEEDLTRHQKEEQEGTALQTFPDSNLFFVDKAGDEQIASAVAKGLTKKRKQLSKPLRCELIAGVHRPVTKAATQPGHKSKGKLVLPHQRRQPQLQQKHQGKGVYKLPAASTYDLWNVEAEQTDPRLDRHNNIPVEVDAAGCSYNPDVEHHQEALSQAVATEMQKVYKQELLPKRVPRFVDYEPETDELALLQVDAEPDSDDDPAAHSAADAAAAASGKPVTAVSMRTKRIKKDRGLELRRRLREEEDERRRALKAQRRDIDNVKHIQQQLQEEEADREEVRGAKAAAKAEKARHEPPRLGKLKFEAEPVQVLLSEEVSGSLRKLRPTATLTRDRFKSLQRQGIIEPRVAAKGRKQPKRVSYTQGERADNAEAGMEEIRALQNKRKQK
ncbi:hypothetical protein WJX77_011316 [Trebouxia sp. C0004]